MDGTPQEEGVVDPIGTALTVRQEPNMVQLMQTIVKVIQRQQQLPEQQQIHRDTPQQHDHREQLVQ